MKTADDLSVGLEDLLYVRAAGPAPVAALQSAIAAKRKDFRAARYDRLAAGLPGLTGSAIATRQSAGSAR